MLKIKNNLCQATPEFILQDCLILPSEIREPSKKSLTTDSTMKKLKVSNICTSEVTSEVTYVHALLL